MSPSGLQYFPVAPHALLLLLILLGILGGLVAARLLRFASASMGVGSGTMLAVLALSLLGSYVNIPIAYWPEQHVRTTARVFYFGIPYVVPLVREWPATELAINLGGAVIPTVLSLYLIVKNRLYAASAAGTCLVAAVCYSLAQPVAGIGIAEPIFVPALVTALTAALLSRRYAGALAYVCGSLGTLLGADILNLGKVRGLGAPVASIGGAGTFDGIFLIGLLSVVYAGLFARSTISRQP